MGLRNKNILLTGGAGFIGSHLVDRLINENPNKIVIVDNFFLGRIENLSFALKKFSKLQIVRENAEDLSLMESVMKKEDIDIVFNLATKPLKYSFINPKGAYMTSVKIAEVLANLLRKDMYRTLVHFSSSEAYGSAKYVPMDEEHPLNPTTLYSAGKAAADLLLMAYYKTFGLDISIIRPFNNYGPRQNDTLYAAVIPITIKRVLDGRPPILEWDGKQTRDFTFVKDTVEATIKIYKERDTRGKIINIADGRETSILEIIKVICKILGYNGKLIKRPKRYGDVRRHYADISLAKRLINFKSKTSLGSGLEETVRWYVSNFERKEK